MNKKQKRLYRSKKDKMISGICGGIAKYLDTDPSLVRILWVLAGFITGGTALLVYIILSFVIPEEA